MTGDAELAAEYDRARGYNLPPADRPQVRAHLVGLTDEERDLLRDWWDEDTTVGVESLFPTISRILTARREEYHALHLGVLAQAQREAWERGFNAGEHDVWNHERGSYDEPCIPNPYRITRPGMPDDSGPACDALWSRNMAVSCHITSPHTVHRGSSEPDAPSWGDGECVPGTLTAGRGGR